MMDVLVVENNPAEAELLQNKLREGTGFSFRVNYARTFVETLHAVQENTPDLIVLSLTLPDCRGMSAVVKLRTILPHTALVVLTAPQDEATALEALRQGAQDYLLRGQFDSLLLVRTLRYAVERQKTEMALLESRAQFAAITQAVPVPVVISRLSDGLILFANERFASALAVSPEESIGKHSITFYENPDDRDRILAHIRQESYIENQQVALKKATGELVTVLASLRMIHYQGEEALLTAFQDITQEKQAEVQLHTLNAALERSNQELNALYNATSYLFKADSLPNLLNQIVQAVVNEFRHAECALLLLNKPADTLQQLAHAGEQRGNQVENIKLNDSDLLRTAVQSGAIVYVPKQNISPSAVRVDDIESQLVVPLVSSTGVLGVFNLASTQVDAFSQQDQRILTAFAERAAAAIEIMRLYDEINHYAGELEWRVAKRTAELSHAKERVEAILNSSSDAIILANVGGVVKQTNPAFSQQFGYDSDELFRKSLLGLVDNTQTALFEESLRRVNETRRSTRIELLCKRKDGSLFSADAVIAPIEEDDNRDLNIICSIRDISERKLMEKELRAAYEKERELNELKTRFVSMVSHEFRTPLATILSSSDLIKNYSDRLSEERKQGHFEKIQAQVQRLSAMLDSVLTLTRAETVGLNFNPTPINLEQFCQDLIEDLQLTAAGHTLLTSVEGDCTEVNIDMQLMQQALSNLLSNAIKYSPQGKRIYLEVMCAAHQIIFKVRDEGIGIPLEDQQHLFQVFHRAQNVGTTPGTGLGLVIVKNAIEAHGGTISVESILGTGTTFTITLPIKG